MVEVSLSDTKDPQTFDKDLEEVNLILAQTRKPILCLEHKMDIVFVNKTDLSSLCPLCIVGKDFNNTNLVLCAKLVQEIRE